MSRKNKKTRTRKVRKPDREQPLESAIFRDRKPGTYNQLWDWKTGEDVEIKGALKFG